MLHTHVQQPHFTDLLICMYFLKVLFIPLNILSTINFFPFELCRVTFNSMLSASILRNVTPPFHLFIYVTNFKFFIYAYFTIY
jgi:hypothetical protein